MKINIFHVSPKEAEHDKIRYYHRVYKTTTGESGMRSIDEKKYYLPE